MIYFLWFPFAMGLTCFICTFLNRSIPTDRKKHSLAISLGFTVFAAAVAQPIHNPWLYSVAGITAAMACCRFIWEAAEWQRQQVS